MKMLQALGFLVATLGAAPTPAATYRLTDLGTLGRTESVATGINASGQVVGFVTTGNVAHAFISAPNGGVLPPTSN